MGWCTFHSTYVTKTAQPPAFRPGLGHGMQMLCRHPALQPDSSTLVLSPAHERHGIDKPPPPRFWPFPLGHGMCVWTISVCSHISSLSPEFMYFSVLDDKQPSRHAAEHERLHIAMKATVFSLVLVLTSHNAGAFVSQGSLNPNVNNLHTQQHHDARRSSTSHSNARATAISRVARRRHLHRAPCAMSAAGSDNATEAGDKDGEDESTSAIPPASESNAIAADEAAGAGPDAAECLQGWWRWRLGSACVWVKV